MLLRCVHSLSHSEWDVGSRELRRWQAELQAQDGSRDLGRSTAQCTSLQYEDIVVSLTCWFKVKLFDLPLRCRAICCYRDCSHQRQHEHRGSCSSCMSELQLFDMMGFRAYRYLPQAVDKQSIAADTCRYALLQSPTVCIR